MKRDENLQLKINMLPDSPGCYLMKDAEGTIIYVGKAVNLKNRVRSYFRESGHTPKVAAMVAHIADFEVLLCETNLEALCLECNLIKRHAPHYNILLKDDKHYPYIRLDLKEPYPRLQMARRMESDGAKYFGPYIGATAVKQVLEAVRHIFPMRTCSLNLPLKSPQRPCIHYDIGRCMAPCAGKCTEAAYWDMMDGAVAFLNGDYRSVTDKLKEQMMKASESMQYEKAALYRDRLKDVQGIMERQIAIRTDHAEQDILALKQDGLDAMAQILYVRGGRMIGGDHFLLTGEGGEEPAEVLASFMTQYYTEAGLIPRHVLCQSLPEGSRETLESWLRQVKGAAVTLAEPKRGEKHDLVLLAAKNAEDALEKRNAKQNVKEERTIGASKALAKALGLKGVPRRIEGYDISNTQGVLSVAAMVVFMDGMPDKKEYRHFRIKTVEGANDFASLAEVIGRRFRRAKEDGEDGQCLKFGHLPDVILIDGGPQQLQFARDAMHAEGFDIPMFGLAEKNEEIWLPGRDEPIVLDRREPALQLVQRVRNEAHRFGITHHRALRGKTMSQSKLDQIPGIGEKRRRALLMAFPSLKAICSASLEELEAVPGMNRTAAEAVHRWAEKEREKK